MIDRERLAALAAEHPARAGVYRNRFPTPVMAWVPSCAGNGTPVASFRAISLSRCSSRTRSAWLTRDRNRN